MGDSTNDAAVRRLQQLAEQIPAFPPEVRRAGDRAAGIENRDGLSWHDAPLPPRRHECEGWSLRRDALGLVDMRRCACGGVWMFGWTGWIRVNSRRKDEPAGERAWGGRAWVRLVAVFFGASVVAGAGSMAGWWLLDGGTWSVVVAAAGSVVIGLVAILLFPFSWIATGRRGWVGSE